MGSCLGLFLKFRKSAATYVNEVAGCSEIAPLRKFQPRNFYKPYSYKRVCAQYLLFSTSFFVALLLIKLLGVQASPNEAATTISSFSEFFTSCMHVRSLCWSNFFLRPRREPVRRLRVKRSADHQLVFDEDIRQIIYQLVLCVMNLSF